MAKVVNKSLDLNHDPAKRFLPKSTRLGKISLRTSQSAPLIFVQAHLEQSPQTTVMTIADKVISIN
jgi:hypothetical protein